MELQRYVRLALKWWWLIILGAICAGAVSFLVSKPPVPVFHSETTIAVGRYFDSPNPTGDQIGISSQLVSTYQQIVQTQNVLQGAIDTLKLSLSVDDLRSAMQTYVLNGTSLMVIGVTDTNEKRAASLSDEIANQLIIQSPTNITQDEAAQIKLAREQIDLLQTQLERGKADLADIDDQLKYTTAVEDVARLTAQRTLIVSQINDASSTIAQFSGTIVSIEQRTNQLNIIQHAQVTKTVVGTSRSTSGILGAFAGVLVTIVGILLIEFLDNKFKAPEDVGNVLGVRVLGGIPQFGKKKDIYPTRLVSGNPELGPVMEAFQRLRINLLHADDSPKSNVFIVTSASPQEGKSVTISNLAAIIAEAGLQVLLIDADLRNPTLHKIFQLSNERGLTNLVSEKPLSRKSGQLVNGDQERMINIINTYMQSSRVDHLKVITSGFIPANPTEILGSTRMHQWVDLFLEVYGFDVILIDTPPAFITTDASALAVNLGAEVVLLIDIKQTKRGVVMKVREDMTNLGLHIKGVIVNKSGFQDSAYTSVATKHYYTNNFNGRYVNVNDVEKNQHNT